MIISVDHKGLEWVTAVFLSQDKVGLKEIWNGIDQHGENQKVLGLPPGPVGRNLAKIFVFRLIYGGTKFGYANDPDFISLSGDPEFWEEIINKFYAKYTGLADWHEELLEIVGREGYIEIPSGRQYHFKPYLKRGEWVLPRTQILNYPVQGFGTDIVQLSRISLATRMGLFDTPKYQSKLINTVHDDIWIDVYPPELEQLKEEIKGVFNDLPTIIEKAFDCPFNLPTRYEIKSLTGSTV